MANKDNNAADSLTEKDPAKDINAYIESIACPITRSFLQCEEPAY